MLKVGITGGIGSGKSKVCQLLEARGYPVFYSDDRAKYLTDHNPQIREKLVELFGADIYHSDGLNRPRLADKIFSDEELRNRVNAIIHPEVRACFESYALEQSTPFVFNEAAILIETGAYKNFDAIVLVTAPEELRIKRVQKRDRSSEEDVRQRISKQWTDDKKRKYADFEIINDETGSLNAKVDELINYLTSSHESKSSSSSSFF